MATRMINSSENKMPIKQRDKDAVSGFMRRASNDYIPCEIIQICISFWGGTDRFDKANISKWMEWDLVSNSLRRTWKWSQRACAYLENIVSSGCHEWKFKIVECSNNGDSIIMIGIWRSKGKMSPPLDTLFNLDEQGYGYMVDAGRRSMVYNQWDRYGVKCVSGDIVEMTLNFDDLSLSFKVNGRDYGRSHHIKAGEYRAAVFMMQLNQEIQFLGYQQK